jgi:serine/threonine-protein kinase RsbT
MAVVRHETRPIKTSDDVVGIRQLARDWAIELGFSLVEQTKLVTAASELARNVVTYAKAGQMRIESLNDGPKRGLRLVFEDEGPGIPDVEKAMRDGFSTGGGLGLGLGGAKRLCNEFAIDTAAGRGTKVTIARWK